MKTKMELVSRLMNAVSSLWDFQNIPNFNRFFYIAQKCPDNEYWEPNGEPCLRTSENPRPDCLFQSPKPGCVCNTGFRRNSKTSQCEPVSKLFILKQECSKNETFSFCGSDCATNCFDESKRHMCPTLCKRGCFCNDGYRRDNAGNCVLPDDCKHWSGGHVTPVFRV